MNRMNATSASEARIEAGIDTGIPGPRPAVMGILFFDISDPRK